MINKNKPEDKKKSDLASAFVRYSNRVAGTVLRGIKMANANMDPFTSPMKVLEMLKEAGPQVLVWKPETLCAYLDQKYNGWDPETAAAALEYFHTYGMLDTDVPPLVRQKLYALRIIMTSDSAHREWHVFEKIGCAFNDRLASFSVVEPMNPAECAKTIAIIDAVRPDEFGYEVKTYIAAACHTDGLYTLKPSKYLSMSDELLSMMNREETGRQTNDKIVSDISSKIEDIKKNPDQSVEDFVSVQALKLLAIDTSAKEVLE